MIRLRLGARVPPNAANLAYVYAPSFTVEDNLSLIDLSYTRPENISAFGGVVVVDLTSATHVETEDVVLSSRSVLSRNVSVPVHLFYKYRIGRGTYYVYSKAADETDTGAARAELQRSLFLLDRNDNRLEGLDWDINVVGTDGQDGFLVDLYLSRRPKPNETFKVKFDAQNISTNQITTNHIEVINASPESEGGVNFTLNQQTNGFTISGLDAATDYAPAVGAFYNGSNPSGSITVTSTQFQVLGDDTTTYYVTYTGKTVAKVVAELNELNLEEYQFTQLSPATSFRMNTGTFNPQSYGLSMYMDEIVHIKYNEETRIRLLKPYRDPTSKPWYPRVDVGQFLQDYAGTGGASKVLFGVPEYSGQTWSYTYGSPWRDMTNDQPVILGEKMLGLRRAPVNYNSVKLYQDGREITGAIQDIDTYNGVVFLSQKLKTEVVADYAYQERTYVYTGVDLNTTSLHSPNLFGKYIGVYATPYKILGSAWTQTFSTCIRHVVRDTYNEVVEAVDGVLFDDSTDPEAFLLGVFRPVLVADTDEIEIVDTRVRGGGIMDGIEETDEPESAFYWDIGRWGGKPFQDKGSLIVGVPANMIGTGSSSIRASIPIAPTGFYAPTGKLSREFIQRAVDRHAAGGHLAVLWQRRELNATGSV